MKAGNTFVASIALACVLAMAGCASTLFFPLKSAEKAADKVIQEIWTDIDKPAVAGAGAKKG